MSVSIRLSRTGRKNLPSYRLVATQTRTKRDGKVLDIIGHFNPSNTPVSFDYDKKKYMDWVSKGAIVSEAVKKLIDGNYEYVKYSPNKDKGTEEKAAESTVSESPVEEAPVEETAEETTAEPQE